MHNHIAYRIAKAFKDAGISALRFNFRGVGRSSGTYDHGRGEIDDGRAAIDFLVERIPLVPCWVAGFSFGSRVALQLAVEDPRVEKVLAAGMATNLFDFDFFSDLPKPKAFIQSECDEYAALKDVESLIGRAVGPKKLWTVPNATHLCPGKFPEFEAAAQAAVQWLVAAE